jgi:type I restriction enzyme S subunit
MGEWREYTVGEFADVVGGGTPKTSIEAFWGGEIPWISPKDLSDYNDRRIQRGERNISSEGLKSSSAKVLPKNSVLLTSRAPVGYLAIADNEITTNQGFRSLVVKEDFDFLFVYYLLKNNVEYLKQHATGSTFQELSGSTLKGLKFRLPEDKKEQQKISSILSSLDDKIELNRKMNETLEEMARAIFKSWFVDFDPVHAKARGEKPAGMPDEIADLFPPEFVHSDQLNKPIPKGWKVVPISSLAELNAKSWTKKNAPESVKYIDLANTKDGEIHSIAGYLFSEAPSRARRILSVGDTIIGTVRPGNRSFAYIANDGYTGSTGFAVMTPKKAGFREFIYIALTQSATIDYFAHLADGAAYPAIRPEVVANYELVIPNEEVIKAFSELTFDVFSKIFMQKEQNFSLTQLRDSLLPKLISGEIEV